jgi:sugar phosphate isomerase/epimerase
LLRLVSAAEALDIRYVYGPAGGILPLEWEEGAAAFTRAVEPLRPVLEQRGVTLLVEPTNYLWADISFLHTLRDTVDLAEMADVGVCIDVQHCWSERGLRETIRRAAPRVGLVQISDLIPDRHERFRAVPGDGALPLLRIMDWVLEAGYDGNFDLELSPEPGTDPRETVARAVERAGLLLRQLGV